MSAAAVPPEIPKVAAPFPLSSVLLSATSYGNEHINETYLAVCADGAGTRRYVFQKINQRVFKNPVALMENIARDGARECETAACDEARADTHRSKCPARYGGQLVAALRFRRGRS